MAVKELSKEALVSSYKGWWHSIDFGDGVVSPGRKTPQIHADEISRWFPHDFFPGKRVLDIGTWDGFYAFYAEKMGASEVVAADKFVWEKLPWVSKKNGFDLAKSLLGSNVQDYVLDVYELRPEVIGTFDSIIFAGVFYHLENPYESIKILDRLLNPNGRIVIETRICTGFDDVPMMEFHPKNSCEKDYTNFWSPNVLCLQKMFEEVGDYRVENTDLTIKGRASMVVRKK